VSKRATYALIAFVLVTMVAAYLGYQVGKDMAQRDNARDSALKGETTR
jgi:membrane protein implicated in regulation of membrane protease activity